MKLRNLYYLPVYWGTLLVFAVGGLEVSAVSLLFGWLPATAGTERVFQRFIHYHFRFFHEWCALVNLVQVRYEGWERIPPGGVVLVSNHISLIDVTCLIANIPEALCIFKPAIRRNPVLGAGARRAGYLGSDGGQELVRRAVEKVSQGQTMLVFPEGTRGREGKLLPFKPGFASIARRAHAPVQLIRITTNSDMLTKGRPILWLPRVPTQVTITVGPLLESERYARSEELAQAVEGWYRGAPIGEPACAAPEPALT